MNKKGLISEKLKHKIFLHAQKKSKQTVNKQTNK